MSTTGDMSVIADNMSKVVKTVHLAAVYFFRGDQISQDLILVIEDNVLRHEDAQFSCLRTNKPSSKKLD